MRVGSCDGGERGWWMKEGGGDGEEKEVVVVGYEKSTE